MLNIVRSTINDIAENFSWVKVNLYVGLLLLAIIGVVVYEGYTGHFALSRLDHETELLERLSSINDSIDSQEEEKLAQLHEQITSELLSRHSAPASGAWNIAPEWAPLLTYNLLPWVAICVLMSAFGDFGSRRQAIAGLIVFALPFVVVGTFLLPDFVAKWVVQWLYPWGSMLAVVTFVTLWGRRAPAN